MVLMLMAPIDVPIIRQAEQRVTKKETKIVAFLANTYYRKEYYQRSYHDTTTTFLDGVAPPAIALVDDDDDVWTINRYAGLSQYSYR